MRLLFKLFLICWAGSAMAFQFAELSKASLNKPLNASGQSTKQAVERSFVTVINNLSTMHCAQSNCNVISVSTPAGQSKKILPGASPLNYFYSGLAPTLQIAGTIYKRNGELCAMNNADGYIVQWHPVSGQRVYVRLVGGVVSVSIFTPDKGWIRKTKTCAL